MSGKIHNDQCQLAVASRVRPNRVQRKLSRACQKLKPGDLFCLIDEWGRNQGSAVLLAIHAPWTLSSIVNDNAGFWHYELLHEGTKKFVRSGFNTLMPLVNEEDK